MFKVYTFHQLNNVLIKISLGILLIILISSKILLLFDKNLITVSEDELNISKNTLGIFSGFFSKTLKNTLSKN